MAAAFDGLSSCHPSKRQGELAPCTLDVHAEATDPEGDLLTYSWTGCASGSAPRAVCTVSSPGAAVATVTVRDTHGNSARASLDAYGSNAVPYAVLNTTPPHVVGRFIDVYGDIHDPDDPSQCKREWCTRTRARAEFSGACRRGACLECYCSSLDAEVYLSSAGTCTVTVVLEDDWGLEGRSSIQFEVQP